MMYGEVDDVLAAARYLAQQPKVDPNRIYLGGHGSGAALALLVAAAPNPFQGVIAYEPKPLRIRPNDYQIRRSFSGHSGSSAELLRKKEVRYRNYQYFYPHIRVPTVIIEGQEWPGLERDSGKNHANPYVTYHKIRNASRDTVHAPVNAYFAKELSKSSAQTPFDAATDTIQVAYNRFWEDHFRPRIAAEAEAERSRHPEPPTTANIRISRVAPSLAYHVLHLMVREEHDVFYRKEIRKGSIRSAAGELSCVLDTADVDAITRVVAPIYACQLIQGLKGKAAEFPQLSITFSNAESAD